MGTLKPDYYLDTVHDIRYGELWENNIRGLIFDIDNTIAPYEEHEPNAKIKALFRRLKGMGFQISLLTNNTNRRLSCFAKPLEIGGLANAAKPFGRRVRKLMKQMSVAPRQTAVIGDQILADIWAGKNAGTTTVLVKPLSKRDLPLVNIRRKIEKRLLTRYYGHDQ